MCKCRLTAEKKKRQTRHEPVDNCITQHANKDSGLEQSTGQRANEEEASHKIDR
jgi:hypothetical protein